MQVPAQYCGLAEDVRKTVRKQVRAYVRGASWQEAVDGRMVHADEVAGLIYLDGPTFTGTPRDPQIYLYMPYLEVSRLVVRRELPISALDELRETALGSDWGTAVVLGGLVAKALVLPATCWARVIRVAVERWPTLDAEGARYAAGTHEGKRLWVVAGGLHYAIGGMGVRDFPMGRGIVFEPRTFLAEHGILDKVMSATTHP